MSDKVTCRTCKHNRASWLQRTFNLSPMFWDCSLDYRAPEYDPVTGGSTKGYYESCSVVRVKDKICGKDAKAWAPYYKRDILTYLKRI
jgi:hypothetical protein